ncbi:ATP-binding protein [Actinomadura flavalba]|uniref:ATP-binding protein n=1 Tax=Actinomadura flavalba TaxID=1120938 RepID=UPI0003809684|nr:ATP-binding protein [Actinomadura flavalba]
MDLTFSLALPREDLTIPMVRRLLGDVLRDVGATEDCVDELLLALSEGCTNAVQHASGASGYEVVARIDGGVCVLEITDFGAATGETSLTGETDQMAESGRGLRIMRALVDDLTIDSSPDRGTVVHLRKRLAWRDEALIRRLDRQLMHSAG